MTPRRRQRTPARKVDYPGLLSMQCLGLGLPIPEREVYFAKETFQRMWRLDLLWRAAGLAVEVDGAVFKDGRHNRGAGYTEDRVKDAHVLLMGWRVLHVTTTQVSNGTACRWIQQLLAQRSPLCAACLAGIATEVNP